MSFTWRDYSALAAWLLSQAGTHTHPEACHRSTISRAYYAVFRTARDLLDRRHLMTVKGDRSDHLEVVRTLKRQPSSEFQRVGVDLDRLQRQRNRADYEAAYAGVDREAEAASKMAETALQRLSRL